MRAKLKSGIDWVIVGGESGPGARPFDIQWARQTVEQCESADTAVFVKQLGARPYWPLVGGFGQWGEHVRFRCGRSREEPFHWDNIVLRDREGGDISEWPEDLRVRQFPEAHRAAGL
jgi:protein gp37